MGARRPESAATREVCPGVRRPSQWPPPPLDLRRTRLTDPFPSPGAFSALAARWGCTRSAMESPSRDTKTLKRSSSSREIMDGMVRLKDSPELQYRLLLVFGLFLLWLSRSTVITQVRPRHPQIGWRAPRPRAARSGRGRPVCRSFSTRVPDLTLRARAERATSRSTLG